jgi:hypothetical protein
VTDHALRRDRYREWLIAQNIPFGFPAEVAALADRVSKGITNGTPSPEHWLRIVPTLRVLEHVRHRFGPTTLQSAYRSIPYNIAIGGVGDSRHSKNDAIDFRCRTGTPEQWAEFLRGLRKSKVFTGGIGTYKTFVHVDTRGTVADWDG